MHFDRIPKAETAQVYFETALTRGRVSASRVKKIKDPVILVKAKEKDRIRTIRDSLAKSLKHVHDAYPSFDHMHEFTRQVFSLDMEIGRVKQALGGLQHAVVTIRALAAEHIKKIAYVKDRGTAKRLGGAFLGRVSSVLKQTARHLLVLNEARTVFRALPVVDDTLFTVAIAGFPNVGKSTLLGKMTSADPDVQPYAFTTKGLNVGYFEYKYNKIQCIDTPGALNRAKMNAIEKKAELVNKYLAHVIIYVFDPTEGYSLEKQRALFAKEKELAKPMFVYVSKADLVAEAAEKIRAEFDGFTDSEQLRKELVKAFKKWV